MRWHHRRAFALGLAAFAMALAVVSPSVADPANGAVKVDVSGGYARLIFSVRDDVDATARLANNVLIISFSQPTLAAIDRLAAQAPDYISAARRDPDGRAVRMAVARKVKLNSIRAGESSFSICCRTPGTDLRPDFRKTSSMNWRASRAKASGWNALRGRARWRRSRRRCACMWRASRPFVRYVFDVPEQTAVSADRAKDRLTLTFDAPITFDLADAEALCRLRSPRSMLRSSRIRRWCASVSFPRLTSAPSGMARATMSMLSIPERKPNDARRGRGKTAADSQRLKAGPSEKASAEGAPRALLRRLPRRLRKNQRSPRRRPSRQRPPAILSLRFPPMLRRDQMRRRWHLRRRRSLFRRSQNPLQRRHRSTAGGATSAAGRQLRQQEAKLRQQEAQLRQQEAEFRQQMAKSVPQEAKPVPAAAAAAPAMPEPKQTVQDAKPSSTPAPAAEPKAAEDAPAPAGQSATAAAAPPCRKQSPVRRRQRAPRARQPRRSRKRCRQACAVQLPVVRRRCAASARQVRRGRRGGAVARRRQPEIVISL